MKKKLPVKRPMSTELAYIEHSPISKRGLFCYMVLKIVYKRSVCQMRLLFLKYDSRHLIFIIEHT